MVSSQITQKEARLIESIPISVIIQNYNTDCGIDVTKYFNSVNEIQIYECQQTGYKFYYPFNLAGDGEFYEQLQKFDWYYANWKWDYSIAKAFVPDNSKVLDIGCGYGHFLTYLQKEKKCDCTGLEFNDKACETARNNGIEIYKEYIQDFAEKNIEKFDVVCVFQVLEHISDINSFLTSAIKSLKRGGTLIVCVPNNNPYYYQFDKYHSLNLPPHHMSIWNNTSLKNLTDVYPLNVEDIVEERVSRYRFYTKLYINQKFNKKSLKKALYTALSPFLTLLFFINRNKVNAGSILAAYKKT